MYGVSLQTFEKPKVDSGDIIKMSHWLFQRPQQWNAGNNLESEQFTYVCIYVS